jgi:1-aminocyclopropane-1-carboxylate deaminase/D-cysteine desulfhydrase-like pyridoxal-dependent ACC family enzyme
MFKKMTSDRYDFVQGCNILQKVELDICYSAKALVWYGLSTGIVPRGF